MTTRQKVKITSPRLWIPLAVLLLAAAAGGGYLLWRQQSRQAATVAASPYQTTAVRRGDIVRSASGSGTLVAGSQADLSFPVAGTLDKVNVSVGDKVTAGEELASLAGIDQLQLAVQTQQIALKQAQKSLDDLTANATQTLADAQIALASAQSAYADAKNNLLAPKQERCNDTLTSQYYYQYLDAQKYVDIWQAELNGPSKYGKDFILEHLNKYKSQRDTAYNNWAYCNSYTAQEVANSQSTLQLAKADMDLAQSTLQKLTENNGIDPTALALAKARVQSAQSDLVIAQNNLKAAVLTAPMNGTVLSVAGQAGDEVGTSTFIVLADLDHPAIQVNVDETDLQNIAVGCSASISFDSIPNRTFDGSVSQITPQLVASGGSSAVQALVNLTSLSLPNNRTLPIGLSGSAEVTCGQANNVLLVPVEALHTQPDGSIVVYVLASDGMPEQRTVEVGMQDYTNAEIRSGLQAGELVITQGPGIPN